MRAVRTTSKFFVGGVSLYLLAIADSGERKTSCDAIFGAALRRWESDRRQALSPDIKKCEAAIATFEAKKSGLLDAIKLKRRRSLDSTKGESSLEVLVQEAPLPLPVPRLLYPASQSGLAERAVGRWRDGHRPAHASFVPTPWPAAHLRTDGPTRRLTKLP